VKALQLIDSKISNQGILMEWFQTAKEDPSEWNDKISTLEPPKQDSVFNFDFLDSHTNPLNDQATDFDERDLLSPLPNIPSAEP
jgi:hypothetical protein